MARQFNFSNSNGSTSRNALITNQDHGNENEFLRLQLGQNQVNGATSQLLYPSQIIGFHRNGQNLLCLNRFDLSQRRAITTNTNTTPSRVEVHRSFEYLPRPNSHTTEVIVTEVVRTTRYLTLTPNLITEPCLFITPPNNVYINIQNPSYIPNSSDNSSISSAPINQIPPTNTLPLPLVETEGDGMTHSLPHEKHGPYTCPRCLLVFSTSQKFGAHMTTHYKYESTEESRKRRATKYKHKYCNANGASTSRMPASGHGANSTRTNSNSEGDIIDNNNGENLISEGFENVEATSSKHQHSH